MVSFSGHLLPLIVAVAIWFFATGLIAWADNLERRTFPRSLMIGAGAGLVGLVAVTLSLSGGSIFSVYLGFVGALLIWGWHEVAFLTGAVGGPRRVDCDQDVRGFDRFAQASATVIFHEIALALTALLLISLSWGAANPIGAVAFLLLFVMRLSAKLNIFAGVPNSTAEMLPPHLSYLRTYFGPQRLTIFLPITIALLAALAFVLAQQALAAPDGSAERVAASLAAALALLGALEHCFLALPFRDGMLWGWALKRRRQPLPIDEGP